MTNRFRSVEYLDLSTWKLYLICLICPETIRSPPLIKDQNAGGRLMAVNGVFCWPWWMKTLRAWSIHSVAFKVKFLQAAGFFLRFGVRFVCGSWKLWLWKHFPCQIFRFLAVLALHSFLSLWISNIPTLISMGHKIMNISSMPQTFRTKSQCGASPIEPHVLQGEHFSMLLTIHCIFSFIWQVTGKTKLSKIFWISHSLIKKKGLLFWDFSCHLQTNKWYCRESESDCFSNQLCNMWNTHTETHID